MEAPEAEDGEIVQDGCVHWRWRNVEKNTFCQRFVCFQVNFDVTVEYIFDVQH